MARIAIFVVISALAVSILIANFYYIQYQPNLVEANYGEPILVGPVKYTVEHIGEHKGDENTTPKGTFFKIRIIAENLGVETLPMSGGQFHLIDQNNIRHQPVFGEFSEEDLFIEKLEPGKPLMRTTQFDIEYDEDIQYKLGITPRKEHATRDIGMVCLTNC